jgi:hypothetical protein
MSLAAPAEFMARRLQRVVDLTRHGPEIPAEDDPEFQILTFAQSAIEAGRRTPDSDACVLWRVVNAHPLGN